MMQFAIQLNKNSFGLVPPQPLQVVSPLAPNQTYEASLPLNPSGPVQRMDPLTNLQVSFIYFLKKTSSTSYVFKDKQCISL